MRWVPAIVLLASTALAAPAEVVRVSLLDLVLLARDETGAPVDDLDASEIEVRWNGEPLAFRVDREAPEIAGDAALPPVRLVLQLGAEERVANPSAAPPRNYLFFIDRTSDSSLPPDEAAAPLVDFLRETMSAQDRAAVVVFNGELAFESGFVSDPERVAEAVRRAYDRGSSTVNVRAQVRGLVSRIERCESVSDSRVVLDEEEERMARASTFDALSVDPDCVRGVAESFVTNGLVRAEAFLRAMELAIRFAGGVEGRTDLVALTHGVTLEPGRIFLEAASGVVGPGPLAEIRQSLDTDLGADAAFERLTRIAAGERVALFAVDSTREPAGMRGARSSSLTVGGASPMELAYRLPTATLAQLADATAGAYVHDRDPYAALRRAAALQASRYRIHVYVPEAFDPDRDRLDVVAARDGVRLTHTPERVNDEAQAAIPVQLTFGGGRPLADSTTQEHYLPFLIGVQSEDLDYRAGGGARVVDLSLHVRVETAAGRHVVSDYQAFRHTLAEGTEERLVGIRGWLEAAPGEYRISAKFRDPVSGKEGRVSRRLMLAPDPPP